MQTSTPVNCLEPDGVSSRPGVPPVIAYDPPRLRLLGELSRLTGGSQLGPGESIGGGQERREQF